MVNNNKTSHDIATVGPTPTTPTQGMRPRSDDDCHTMIGIDEEIIKLEDYILAVEKPRLRMSLGHREIGIAPFRTKYWQASGLPMMVFVGLVDSKIQV